MDPITLGVATRGAMAAGQLAAGFLLRPKSRPKYRIPGEITEATQRSRIRANATTDSILQNDEGNIDQAGANAVKNIERTSTSGSDAVLSASNIAGQVASSKMNAGRAFAGRKIMNESMLDSSLKTQAQYQDKAFSYNKDQPYQEKVDTSNALLQSGMGNIADAADMYENQSLIKGMTGSGDMATGVAKSGTPNVNGAIKSKMLHNFMLRDMRAMTDKYYNQ